MTRGKAALGFLLIAGLALLPATWAYAVEATQAASDHLAMAASYEEKVTVQDALIAEHTKMKQDYKERFFVNEKVTPLGRIREMEDHCNGIIASAQTEKGQLLELAKWHRLRAAELQGL